MVFDVDKALKKVRKEMKDKSDHKASISTISTISTSTANCCESGAEKQVIVNNNYHINDNNYYLEGNNSSKCINIKQYKPKTTDKTDISEGGGANRANHANRESVVDQEISPRLAPISKEGANPEPFHDDRNRCTECEYWHRRGCDLPMKRYPLRIHSCKSFLRRETVR